MKSKKLFGIITLLAIALLIMTSVIPAKATTTPTIWTDKPDYSPEETVTVFGSGFTPFTTVTVTITYPNEVEYVIYTSTDENGDFSCQHLLDGILGIYDVIATDGTNSATTTFTDLTWEFYGWDQVSNSWTKGNLAGWNEGDKVN